MIHAVPLTSNLHVDVWQTNLSSLIICFLKFKDQKGKWILLMFAFVGEITSSLKTVEKPV